MNDTVIEAMSRFEIPPPILRSSVWPRQVSGTGPLDTVCEQRSSLGGQLDGNAQADARGRSDRTTALSSEKNGGAKGIHR
jgi:hypothetical protein